MRFQKSALAATVLATTALLSACGGGGGGSSENPTIPVVPSLQSSAVYQLVLRDAVTGNLITDSLSITFNGTADVRAGDNSALVGRTVTSATGTYNFGVTYGASASEFTITVGNPAKGWPNTGTRVVGDVSVKGSQIVEVKLVNSSPANAAAVNASSAAIAVTATQSTASAGTLAAPIVVATPPKTVTVSGGAQEKVPTASLNVASGTVAKTSDGTPIAPGPVTVSVTSQSLAQASASGALPGGFTTTVSAPAEVLGGVAPAAAKIEFAGFATFSLTDSAGKPITSFAPPIQIGIDLPKTQKNANGGPVAVGQNYPVWRLEPKTGAWEYRGQGTIAEKSPVDPANFTVLFQTSQLSQYSVGTVTQAVDCDATLLISRTLNSAPTAERSLLLAFTGAGGVARNLTISAADSATTPQSAFFSKLPAGELTLNVYDPSDAAPTVSRVTVTKDFCAANPTSVTVPLAPRPTTTVRVDAVESCPGQSVPLNGFVNLVPSSPNGNPLPLSGYLSGGSVTFTGVPVPDANTQVAITVTNSRDSTVKSTTGGVSASTPANFSFNFAYNPCPTGFGSTPQ